jgi:hypothetical protein
MKKTITLAAFWGAAFYLTNPIFSQSPNFKTWEYKESERKEESLAVVKQEFKEFNNVGQVLKYALLIANPIMELVKSLEIEKGSDANGNFEKITKFDEGGEAMIWEKTYLDANNKKARIEFVDFATNPDDIHTRIYKYSETSKKIISTTLTDSKGKKIGEENWRYNKEDEETKYEKWELLANGNKNTEEKTVEYNPDGTLLRSTLLIKINGDDLKEEILFDKNKVKEKKRYKNGEIVSSFGGAGNKTKYDPNKAKVLVDFGNDDQFNSGMWDIVDEMDDKGRKIKTIKTEGVEVLEEILYNYDEKDNLVKMKKIFYAAGEPSGQEEEQVWEYDLHQNKLREASFNNGLLMNEKTYAYQYHK